MSKVRALVDYHHECLYESLAMLFEDRFDFEIFIPVGIEWFTNGIWEHEKRWHDDRVAHQYLDFRGTDRDCGDHWERDSWTHPPRVYKMVTLEQARSRHWDFLLCSLVENELGYHRLAKEVGAKLGLQLGNQNTANHFDLADFAMLSTTRPESSFPCETVTYHQEFDVKNLFTFHYPPEEKDTCCTWVQVLPASSEEYGRFQRLATATPELRWYSHGHDNSTPYWRSNVTTTAELARQMQASRVGIMFKSWSDGYSHVCHNLFAIGKPSLITAGYYLGTTHDRFPKLAGSLMEDGVTCFDVNAHTDAEAVDYIRRLVNDEDYYFKMATAAYNRFVQVVNFDEDAAKIKAMLERVLP